MLDRLKMLNFPTILFCGLTLYNNSGNSSISTTKYSSLIRNAATGKFEKWNRCNSDGIYFQQYYCIFASAAYYIYFIPKPKTQYTSEELNNIKNIHF